jgi:hypothetical protein
MKRIFAMWILVLLGGIALAQAPAAPPKEEPKKKEWYEKLKIGGDLRIRYEEFDQSKVDTRRRERFRLRLNMSESLSDNTKFTFALRTGDPLDPVSDNQTFGDGLSKKTFNIAEAYFTWNPSRYLALNAGKFPVRTMRNTIDGEWDDDVDAEGLAQKFSFGTDKAPGVTQHVFNFALMEVVAREQSTGPETYIMSVQPYYELKTDSSTFTLGGTYEKYDNPNGVAALTFGKSLTGNPLSNAYTTSSDGKTFLGLKSEFKIAEGFAEYKTKLGDLPLHLAAHYYKNNGAYNDQDKAYILRTTLGEAKAEGTWMARYTYYYIEKEALFYAYVQSDVTIATGSKSHRFDFDYAVTGFSNVGFTLYLTKRIDDPTYKLLTRYQLDYTVKF